MAPRAKSRTSAKPDMQAQRCKHSELTFHPSAHALNLGYRHHTKAQIGTAANGSKRLQAAGRVDALPLLDAFPSPLGLADDDITLDPKYPTQSKNAWMKLPERNPVTTRRSVIYVAEPAKIDKSVKFMKEWSRPVLHGKPLPESKRQDILDMDALVAYLKAFYHGLEVRVLPVALSFMAWEGDPIPSIPSSGKSEQQSGPARDNEVGSVGLSTGRELIRIRVRETSWQDAPSSTGRFPYHYQLDLNDLTDVALSLLPPDAYSLLLTAEHDLYESVEDDFCCGRAWGASRVAIVSSARYNPALDAIHGVDTEHVWPASHCAEFVNSMTSVESNGCNPDIRTGNTAAKRSKISVSPMTDTTMATSTPLERAIQAHRYSRSPPTGSDLRSAFLLRVCRTASHELGHCFGLDHCMYRACVMQSTSSVAEDMRQPPYLCPVCEAKMAWAVLNKSSKTQIGTKPVAKGRVKRKLEDVGSDWGEKEQEWRKARLLAMKGFCQGQGAGFAGLAAWSAGLLELMDETAL